MQDVVDGLALGEAAGVLRDRRPRQAAACLRTESWPAPQPSAARSSWIRVKVGRSRRGSSALSASIRSSSPIQGPSFGFGWRLPAARPNASAPSRTAFRTVFRATPRFRAIALIGTLFRKWSARIFTTVSNASIPFPPRTAQCSMRAKKPQRADRSNRNRKRPDGREPSAPSRRAGRRVKKDADHPREGVKKACRSTIVACREQL